MAGARGGNGERTTFTVVVTVDNDTQQIVKRTVLKGSPHLMNRDIVTAKRVLRTAGKLGSRFSRKTRTPSRMKMLTDSVVDRAISSSVLGTLPCPPKAC